MLFFRACTEIKKQADERKPQVVKQANDNEQAGEGLAYKDCCFSGFDKVELQTEYAPQDTASVHRKGGDKIEKCKEDIDFDKLGKKGLQRIRIKIGCAETRPASDKQEDNAGDCEIDERADAGHCNFLKGLFRYFFECGDTAYGQQCDARGLFSKKACDETVADFVNEDAGENGTNKSGGNQGIFQALVLEDGSKDEQDQKKKGYVDSKADTEDFAEI